MKRDKTTRMFKISLKKNLSSRDNNTYSAKNTLSERKLKHISVRGRFLFDETE